MKYEDICTGINPESGEDIAVRVEVIAGITGLSVRRVQQLTQEGILFTKKVIVNGRAAKRYMLAESLIRYIEYISEKSEGKEKTSIEERLDELKAKKLEADIELKMTQNELQSLKKDIASGEYLSREDIEADYASFFIVFKKFCLGLPSKLSGKFRGRLEPEEVRAVEKELNKEVTEQLREFVVNGTQAEK